jgi:hypothetical protein
MPSSEVDFIEEKGKVCLVKRAETDHKKSPFRKSRGAATVRMSTNEIMALTRR